MIRRILVGLGDEEYAASATKIAMELARQNQAELTGLCVFDEETVGYTGSVPIGAGHFAQELREQRIAETKRIIKRVSRDFSQACEQTTIPYRMTQEEGDPLECLIQVARYQDLVICGAKNLFEHGVVVEPPNELARLVHAGVRPLLAVTPLPLRVRRTMIAYSGSMESAKTMRRFIQLRLWPATELRIVTFEHSRGNEEQLLADAVDYCKAHEYNVSSEFVPEPAKKNLLPYAQRWGADLIVMGNSNKSLLMRRILGETMLYTVKHADRPLFLAQ